MMYSSYYKMNGPYQTLSSNEHINLSPTYAHQPVIY